MSATPLKTFIIYARNDKAHKDDLLRHLNPLVRTNRVDIWHDADIALGEEWKKAIEENLAISDIVLVLVSVHCLNSDFIQTEELTKAFEKAKEGSACIIQIILSPCLWQYQPILSDLQGLPEDMKPITTWENRDLAWTNVATGIAEKVAEIHAQKEAERLKKLAAEKAEKERLEKVAAEKAEQERLEKLAAEKAERERLDKIAAEKAEQERLEKLAAEKVEKERLEKLAAEKAEKERLEKLVAEKARKERLEKIAAEKAEKERLDKLTVAELVEAPSQVPLSVLAQQGT